MIQWFITRKCAGETRWCGFVDGRLCNANMSYIRNPGEDWMVQLWYLVLGRSLLRTILPEHVDVFLGRLPGGIGEAGMR